MTTTSALPVDEVTGRPLWAGKTVVPYVTTWSHERDNADTMPKTTFGTFNGQLWLAYGDLTGMPYTQDLADRFAEQRDELGLLWYREPIAPAQGYPLFAEVHAARQRVCMTRRRCQVCGRKFPPGAPVTFLESLDMDGASRQRVGDGRAFYTLTAPACRVCIPIAMRSCPAQRRQTRVIVETREYQPYAVLADVYRPGSTGVTASARQLLMINDPQLKHSMVKQLGVLISEYSEETLT